MVQWGVLSGIVTGVLLAAASPWLGALFTPDEAVRDALVPVLLVAAAFQPVAGVVFVLDGVLIGAGGTAPLPGLGAGSRCSACYAPLVLLTSALGAGLTGVWVVVFGLLFMGGRLVTLVRRARGEAWLVTGAAA